MPKSQPQHQSPEILFNRLLVRGRLRHMHLVAALAQEGSVQRAAAAVGMSQPAATQALSDLEQLLGAELFERHARGVRLTRFGEAFVPVGRNVLQALRAATEAICALQAGAQAFVRLGSIPAASSGVLAQVLPALLAAQPDWRIELIEENTVHLLPELAAGRLDAVVCRRPKEMPTAWQFELLVQDAPVILAMPGHPLVGRRSLALDALTKFPWILPPEGVGVRDYYDDLWEGKGVRPQLYPLATTALPLVLEVMRSAQAVSLMPRSIAQSLIDTGVAVLLEVQLPPARNSPLQGIGLLTTAAAESPVIAELRARLRAAGRC